MNVPEGDGQSASFLNDLNPSPDFPFIEPVEAKLRRFDVLIQETSPLIPIEQFDCLVVDVQGMELDVLIGMGKYLDNFNFLNIECSQVPTFDHGPSAQQIVNYLADHGFVQDSPIEVHNDVMFINKRKL